MNRLTASMIIIFLLSSFWISGCKQISGSNSEHVKKEVGTPGINEQVEAEPVDSKDKKTPIVFAVFAETEEQKIHAGILAESLRAFAGKLRNAPIWIYMPEGLLKADNGFIEKMASLNVEIKSSQAPKDSLRFYFARKVFAAAKAESEASETAEIVVWMDEDTIVLRQPEEFSLSKEVSFGYRPVMHNIIGSPLPEPPSEFWRLVYEKLNVSESSIFQMVTPADNAAIRPYFNAGLLVVRPERKIFRKWAESFKVLYQDPVIVEMCNKDIKKRIFLHQIALVGAALNLLKPDDMQELSSIYNYPLFFHLNFKSDKKFDSIEEIVSIRYDTYFRNPKPNWYQDMKGPVDKIAWMKARFTKNDG